MVIVSDVEPSGPLTIAISHDARSNLDRDFARAAFRVADRSIADAEAARVAVLPAADVRLSSLPSTPGLNPIPTMNVEVVGLADTGAPKIKIAAVGRSTSYDECCVISPPPKESMAK